MVEDNYHNQPVFIKKVLNIKCVYRKNLGLSLREQNGVFYSFFYFYQQVDWE